MAKDKIHDAVKNALINDGWKIIHEHFRIEYQELNILADLLAERTPILAERDNRKIIVEIKTFAGRSFMRDLQQALGQYKVYSEIIELSELEYVLYLAISEYAYREYFVQTAASQIIQRSQIKLIVINVGREEVVQWQE